MRALIEAEAYLKRHDPGVPQMFTKVMVANRGEIAIRVFRTLREMGIPSVAVYSEADRDALFAAYADEAYLIGPGPAAESYLNVPRSSRRRRGRGAEAVHPGYGFLAENAGFARACAAAGLVFDRPAAGRDRRDGSKSARAPDGARRRARSCPAHRRGRRRGGPSLARGDRLPRGREGAPGAAARASRSRPTPDELTRASSGAAARARRFADGAVYLERYLDDPRHVEVQVLADPHGS